MDFGNSTPKIHKFTNPLVKICQNFKNYLILFFLFTDEVTVGDNADKSSAASVRCVKDSSRQGLSPSQYSPARFFGLTFYSLIVFSHRLSMNVQKYGMV